MKVLLLTPNSYSLKQTFTAGFQKLGHEVEYLNFQDFIPAWKYKINVQTFRLPYKLRVKWNRRYFRDINQAYLEKIRLIQPDLVFVYNNQMLHPETVKETRKTARIVFFLGDNPYYTPTNNYNLTILMEADLVASPDTFWIEQLKMLGIENAIHIIPGFSEELNYVKTPTEEEKRNYGSDILYIGNSYVDAWGYKRTLFLSKFADFDLKIYGSKNWLRWFEYFPELREKFVLLARPLSFEMVNTLSNCAKIYPVDANPGLLHGLHIRIFDAIASGILPLVEYRKDLELAFKDVEIPIIRNYNQAKELAQFYLEHEQKRKETVASLMKHIKSNYLPEHAIQKILQNICR